MSQSSPAHPETDSDNNQATPHHWQPPPAWIHANHEPLHVGKPPFEWGGRASLDGGPSKTRAAS